MGLEIKIFEFPAMPSLDELGAAMAKELGGPVHAVIRERVYSGEICRQLFGVDGPYTRRTAEWRRGSGRIELHYSTCNRRPVLVMQFSGRDRKFFQAAVRAAESLHGSVPEQSKISARPPGKPVKGPRRVLR